MKTIFHKANSRGHANHGWLNSYHTFSFANYYNADRMNFGALRVLNDDTVDAGRGFGTHPHNNMEIISIPLEGDLQHMDDMGNSTVIKAGDIQIMSAGTGVSHSEYNKNQDKAVKFLQIWVLPNAKNIEPRYDQISTIDLAVSNKLYQIVSPNKDDYGVYINQDAWFYLGNFEPGITDSYTLNKQGNGVYIFVLEGSIEINGQLINERDGLGIWATESFNFNSKTKSNILVMEVPMVF